MVNNDKTYSLNLNQSKSVKFDWFKQLRRGYCKSVKFHWLFQWKLTDLTVKNIFFTDESVKINWFNGEKYFFTDKSVKRQITDSISENLTDSDLESKQSLNFENFSWGLCCRSLSQNDLNCIKGGFYFVRPKKRAFLEIFFGERI